MASEGLAGHKIKFLRRRRGASQVKTASALGISPSYLNLIEHNQRSLTFPLLLKIAGLFDVDLDVFSDEDEARLLADLSETLGDPLFDGEMIPKEELGEIVTATPAIGRAITTLYRAYRSAESNARTLSERFSDGEFLSAPSHEMLTLLTSVRSFAEILRDNPGLSREERERFLGILVSESERLGSLVNRQLQEETDAAGAQIMGARSPADEATDFIERHDNHFPELEGAAEALSRRLERRRGSTLERLVAELDRRHGVSVEIDPWSPGRVPIAFTADKGNVLHLSEMLQPGSMAFEVARRIAMLSYGEIIDDYLASAEIADDAAVVLCRSTLAKYFAGAVLMPYDAFLDSANELRHDIDLLEMRFHVSFEQVCHRFATLRRPGAFGVPFHFVRIDIAGNISKRFSGSGLRIPRFAGACPKWNVHAAFMSPGTLHRELAETPDGTIYLCLARTVTKPGADRYFVRPHLAIGIGCDLAHAGRLVYADGLDLSNRGAAVPIGVSCRLCERKDCQQRAFPSLIGDEIAERAS